MAIKRTKNFRLQVMARYSRKAFNLVVNVFEKNELIKSPSIYECQPDMLIAKYHVHKVDITETDIVVVNKLWEKTLELKIEEII